MRGMSDGDKFFTIREQHQVLVLHAKGYVDQISGLLLECRQDRLYGAEEGLRVALAGLVESLAGHSFDAGMEVAREESKAKGGQDA